MLLTIFFAILLANGVSTKVIEHVWTIAESSNGESIPIDITVGDGSVTTISGKPYPIQPFFQPSVNMYDFAKNLEAQKVIDSRTCFIKKFTGTFDQMEKLIKGIALAKAKATGAATAKATENFNIPGKEIKKDEVVETIGSLLADFCSGYKVVWMNMNKKVIKQALLVKRQWSTSVNGGWDKDKGWGASGGIGYDNGKGFSAGVNGGWNQRGGWGVSAGLSWKFGK